MSADAPSRTGTTSTIPAKKRGMNAVAIPATSQKINRSNKPDGFNALSSALVKPRTVPSSRPIKSKATIGVGVSVRPAVNSVGIAANEPNGMDAKNRYISTCLCWNKAQQAMLQKIPTGISSMCLPSQNATRSGLAINESISSTRRVLNTAVSKEAACAYITSE